MHSRFVGVPELAAELGVDQSTINRRITAGKLSPTAYVGKRAVFTVDDVERLRRGEQQLPREETQR